MADSLREQFIKMLKILFINDKDVELLEDTEIELCTNNDYTCISKCHECKYNKHFKVDVALYTCYDDQSFYYSFRPTDNSKIEYIDSEEKMFKELEFLSAHVANANMRQDSEYLQKMERLRKYAKEFFRQVCSDYFNEVNDTILPIEFLPFYDNKIDASFEEKINKGGAYKRTDRQKVIEIYCCEISDVEDIKQTIRHEIIHYCLDIADLKYFDNSAVFHILCKLFDARAYMDMTTEEQEIYNKFLEIYNNWDNIAGQFERSGVTKQDYIRAFIYIAGSKNKDIEKNFKKYNVEVKYVNKRFA
jgi:hypothetical protein